jgi:P pilus assembly chaperone PapD
MLKKEDIAMKKFLLIAAASLTLAATVPASAQVYLGPVRAVLASG